MRQLLLILSVLLYSATTSAQLKGNGYYRVQNYMSKRYIYVTDNKGKLDYQASTADMGAIKLWKDFDKASSDPASVCYIEKHDNKYDIKAQGTSVSQIIDSYVNIRDAKDGTYYAYGSKDGITKYLSDGEKADVPEGVMSDAGKGEWRKWYIMPIGTGSNNYFGIKPTIKAEGTNYTSFYTAFPYSFASSGMKAFYITKVDKGYAVMKEITGTVPAYTPVFVKVSSDQPVNNKLNIGGSAAAVSGNLMKGVFFDNPSKSHFNRVKYNSKTMRLLGVRKDGKLGFITSTIDYIPANHAYLQVPSGTPAELKLITEEDYDKLTSKQPESITLNKTQITLTEGDKFTLKATVLPDDAFDKSVRWVTNNPAIALIDNGVVTAVSEGIVNVSATTSNGLAAKCEVIVKKKIQPLSIVLDKNKLTLYEGDKYTLKATVMPEDAYDKTIKWITNNPAIALIENGTVTAVSEGIVNVTATTVNGITANCEVTVKKKIQPAGIKLDKTQLELYEGDKYKLTATITPDNVYDNTIKWVSDNPAIARIDNGLVTAVSEGTVNVTATTCNGISATCKVIVKKKIMPESILLSQTEASLYEGDKFTLTATVLPKEAFDTTVKWSTDNAETAQINNGIVTAGKEGTANITATACNGVKATCKVIVKKKIMPSQITLDKTQITLYEGDEYTLKATVLPADAFDSTVKWTTDDPKTAMVVNGTVKAIKKGVINVTATTCNGLTAKCEVIVKKKEKPTNITLSENMITIKEGEEFTLKATITPDDAFDKTVTWTSDSPETATVDNGKVKALKAGVTSITATTWNNLKASCMVIVEKNVVPLKITLDKSDITLFEGEKFTLNATVTPDNASDKSVKWSSDDPAIAKVEGGEVTAVRGGVANITATTSNGLTATCKVTVNVKKEPVSITLSDTKIEMFEGEETTLKATVSPADAYDTTVTWSSDNTKVAVVENGLVKGLKEGVANIKAVTVNGIEAVCQVTVKIQYMPISVTLSKSELNMLEGEDFMLEATVLPEHATDRSITWTSSNDEVATVVSGKVSAIKEGEATITATACNGKKAECKVTVKKLVIADGIALSETSLNMYEGEEFRLTATISPDNATDQTVTWTSSREDVAKVDNGIVKALGEGETVITASTSNGKKAECKVTVKKLILPSGITLNETEVTLFENETVTLTATVTPDDATDKTVTWSTSDPDVASVDGGVVTTIKEGEAVITASAFNGIKAECKVIVKHKVLPSHIIIDKKEVTLFEGEEITINATVFPDDAIDKTITWSTEDAGIATVDNGTVKAVSEGVVTVTAAACNGIKAECKVIVKKNVLPESITLDRQDAEMFIGDDITLKAVITPDDVTEKEVTWSSDNEDVATVNEGKVYALGRGTAVITATTVNGLKAECKITVKDPVVYATSISLDKTTFNAVEGSEFTLVATILPEDVTSKTVEWSSSDEDLATVTDGLVKVLGTGTVTITAATTDGTDLKASCIVNAISGIEEIFCDEDTFPVKVYTVSGSLVKTAYSLDDLRRLSPGIYIIDGKKVVFTR